ncbi:MAG: hypothetical protein LCI00_16740 [Chloroflexi bacterium]|nr:hypothetical protein [Chloroflexota bacterium]
MKLLPPPSFKPYRLFSAGWGTQSTAVLVLQAQGKIKPYDAFVWANVGDDSEHPETIDYYNNHIVPFAARHGIQLIERQRIYKGEPITLYRFVNDVQHSMPLPMYFSEGGKGNRKCTIDFKVEVVNRYFKKEVAMSHVEMGIGFSRDEAYRIHKKYPGWHDHNYTRQPNGTWKRGKKLGFWRLHEFPLTELQLTKAQCIKLVVDAGLPEPPPSLCWWCPFQGRSRMLDKKKNRPEMFSEMIRLEDVLNDRYQLLNHNAKKSKRIGFHPDRIPLREMPDQMELWQNFKDVDECDIGICDV